MKRCVESCLCCYTVRKVAAAQKEKKSKSKVELKREQSILINYIGLDFLYTIYVCIYIYYYIYIP